MFRFWPQRPSALNQPYNKGLGPQPRCIYNFICPDKSGDNVHSSAGPYTESRLTCSVWNECASFPVVEHGRTRPVLYVTFSWRSSQILRLLRFSSFFSADRGKLSPKHKKSQWNIPDTNHVLLFWKSCIFYNTTS